MVNDLANDFMVDLSCKEKNDNSSNIKTFSNSNLFFHTGEVDERNLHFHLA